MLKRLVLPALLTSAAALALAAPASATTFCVPGFGTNCAAGGGNVAEPGFGIAAMTDSSDGIADTIILTNPTISPAASISPSGTDPLTIQGAGPTATTITSTANTNIAVLSLNSRNVTVKDLKVAMPDSFPSGGGLGIGMNGDTLDDVAIVSRNAGNGSDAVAGFGTIRNSSFGEEAGGSLSSAIRQDQPGTMVVEDTTFDGAVNSLITGNAAAVINASRVTISNNFQTPVQAGPGAINIQDAVIRTTNTQALDAGVSPASAQNGTLVADHVTAVNSGAGNVQAISSQVNGSGATGLSNVTVTNSIFRGYPIAFLRQVNPGAGPGAAASLTIKYSNLPALGAGTGTGPGNLTTIPGNITADPLFASASDLTLQAGSPSIDAGDPAAGGPATDQLGAPRIVDGNADGVAITDQGAFEHAALPDTVAPDTQITSGPGSKGKLAKGKAKFKFTSTEPGSTFTCKIDKKAFKACDSPASYKGLDKGKHVFEVVATDAAGNADAKPAKAKFKVKPKKKPKR